MRLLNVVSLELESFFADPGEDMPPYAILSHVWTDEEVTFQEVNGDHSLLKGRKGWKKILGLCAKARSDGFRYTWIDTCCIDKTSSAELSEAINSMFLWYRKASICYVYMDDVPSAEDPTTKNSKFRYSRWFTRGWTLQELLAPPELAFLASDWFEVGTGDSLRDVISEVSKIDKTTLIKHSWDHVSIATIMSWASGRNTTRVEDQAYSLMGIFDVNMPLIYGEGYKAFYRLQVEIMKSTNDESLFAWTIGRRSQFDPEDAEGLGLLAPAPECFSNSGSITRSASQFEQEHPYDMEKHNIRLSTTIVRLCQTRSAIEFAQSRPNNEKLALPGRLEKFPPQWDEGSSEFNISRDHMSRCFFIISAV
ncbi:hypothetical protein ACJ41O_000233 [Fusarium nematophilum]